MLISKNYNYTRKVPRLTVQKWVRCTYTLVLGTSFEIAFSCINKRLPAFLVVFEAVLESTFWNGAELFCNGWMACTSAWRWPFNTRFSRGNKKKIQVDKSGEYGACDSTVIWCTDTNSLTDNPLCGSELSCRRNHAATGTGKIRFTQNNIFEKHITKGNRIFHQLFALVALSASY